MCGADSVVDSASTSGLPPPPPSSCSLPHVAPPPTAPTTRPRPPSPPSPSCRCSQLRPPLAPAALGVRRRLHGRPPCPLPATSAVRGRRPAAAARLAHPGYTTLPSAAAAPPTHLWTATPSLGDLHAPVPRRSPRHSLCPPFSQPCSAAFFPHRRGPRLAARAAAAGRFCRSPPVPVVAAADPRHGLPASRARHAPPTLVFGTLVPGGHGAARGAWPAVDPLLDLMRFAGDGQCWW
ncbi:hypothetical protein BU14_0087s0030 [Porphyra umbilicalis]|uniref:Uncharacterized protein n=1 Tax=Porphyra umbilicalis TaxID=2786 RepID=A0A1X6PEL3_PORUM|nr:hypothetical protein BU14_0087s0030 [Porphyra umbilicalis]|eukprot:OSX79083.1 hypothetical protein BU14_0087s0030 [Porphyra umbilicalis]